MAAYKTLSKKVDEHPVLKIDNNDSDSIFSPNTTDDQNLNEPKVTK